eukprot:11805743-Alexandrium_andersonii.AAC.1
MGAGLCCTGSTLLLALSMAHGLLGLCAGPCGPGGAWARGAPFPSPDLPWPPRFVATARPVEPWLHSRRLLFELPRSVAPLVFATF